MDGLSIAASISETEEAVCGSVIRTIYQPEPGTFILHLFARREIRLLLSPRTATLHLTKLDFAYPQTPSPFTMLLRKHLRGGRIVTIEQSGWDRVVTLTVARRLGKEKETFCLIAELLGTRGDLVLSREDRVIASLRPASRAVPGEVYQPLPAQEKANPAQVSPAFLAKIIAEEEPLRALVRYVDGIGRITAEAIIARAEAHSSGPLAEKIGESLSFLVARTADPQPEVDRSTQRASFFPLTPPGERYSAFAAALDVEWEERQEASQDKDEQQPLQTGILRAIAKRERTAVKLREWLAKADSMERLQHHADLIMIHQRDLTRRMHEATLLDPATGEGVAISLNPRLSPIENAQALYERAKRLRRGRPIVEGRLQRMEAEIARLKAGLGAMENEDGLSDQTMTLISSPRSPKKTAPQTAPRTFSIHGYTAQVGKDAVQNDRLLRSANPEDLWLHAKGFPGSHVFVRNRKRAEYPAEVIYEAALLAARFSRAKGERRVEVSYTKVKHVRKPKGARPGLVILGKEDTLTVELPADKERV